MDVFAIPEHAIGTFERLHQLRVTAHDLCGSLWPHLRADRFRHSAPVCQAVKVSGGEARCLAFEVTTLRPALSTIPQGRVHVCHAGIVEWVVPVFIGAELGWVLFAGPRLPGPDLLAEVKAVEPASEFRASPRFGLASVGREESVLILEHLCQLAARLKSWAVENVALSAGAEQSVAIAPQAAGTIARRRVLVHRFVEVHHRRDAELAELARTLGMSESRASHVVQETCGRSFRDLLTQARLNTAMNLLRGTELSVIEVAFRSGFQDVNHFHRLFRSRLGTTPRRYRTGGDA